MILRLNHIGGNWETLAFIVIKKILIGNNPYFERSELMNAEHMFFLLR